MHEIHIQKSDGSPHQSGDRFYIPLGGSNQDYSVDRRVRVERDLQSDLEMFFPGKIIVRITGAGGWGAYRFDDQAFSNSLRPRNIMSLREDPSVIYCGARLSGPKIAAFGWIKCGDKLEPKNSQHRW